MVARGYGSLSFLSEAAEHISGKDVPVFIYHLGDFDPSGVNAGEKIEETLRELAPDADITFERLAVNKAQIEEWSLPVTPDQKGRSPSPLASATSRSSWTPSVPMIFEISFARPSSGTCRPRSSRRSRPPRNARSGSSDASWSWSTSKGLADEIEDEDKGEDEGED